MLPVSGGVIAVGGEDEYTPCAEVLTRPFYLYLATSILLPLSRYLSLVLPLRLAAPLLLCHIGSAAAAVPNLCFTLRLTVLPPLSILRAEVLTRCASVPFFTADCLTVSLFRRCFVSLATVSSLLH